MTTNSTQPTKSQPPSDQSTYDRSHAIEAIDVHGHYGPYLRRTDETEPLLTDFMSADASTVADRATQCNIAWTVVSPLSGLMPRGRADAVAGNEELARIIPQTPGLLGWVLVDPTRPATYDQAREMLQETWCVGIKIHPEEHVYPIARYAHDLLAFAAECNATILTHSGDPNSMPESFVPAANDFPNARLILAHIGNGFDGDPTHQVRAVQQAKHGNIYADTSSAQSMMSGLIEWAVEQIGVERILFGTDTPLYSASAQRARIDGAKLSDDDKGKILRGNALRLLQISQ